MAPDQLSIKPKIKIPRAILFSFFIFTVGIIILGRVYYRSQINRINKEAQESLMAISLLKIRQIEQWNSERIGNAEQISNNNPLLKGLKDYIANINKPETENDIKKWMDYVAERLDYNGAFIYDTLLNLRLAGNQSISVLPAVTKIICGEVLKDSKVRMTDLYRNGPSSKPAIDLVIPLVLNNKKQSGPFGVVILRIDPEKTLFPLIQSWPTPSKTAETLLIRRDGDSVLYLNDLRHAQNTALNLKFPVTDKNLPAAKAVNGIVGVVEGVDYRKVPVVGYVSSIPGLNWYIVAKIDKEEIQAPLKRFSYISLIVTVLLILIVASVLGFWIWNQRVRSYRNQLKNELAIREGEEKLSFLATRHEAILSSVPDIIMEVDNNKVYTWANKSGFEFFGYDVIGKEAGFYFEGNQEAYQLVQPLFEGGENTIYVESWQRRKDGEKRLLAWWCRVLKDHNGEVKGALSSALDITERKKAEEEILKLNAELEQRVADRTAQYEVANKELEAFSYSVSHDLRAPLRSVSGYTKILMEEYGEGLDDEGKRICGIISSGATQMGSLIDDLLSFSRVGRSSLNPIVIDMRALATEVFTEITGEREKERTNIKIGKLHKSLADANLIRLVWNNLILNAIKYSSKKDISEISINSEREGDTIIYSIKDNGVGFEMQYVHKLFGVFQRLHSESEFEGNGVGLANVKRIISKHNGKVWAEGDVDKGATFYFTLPVNGNGS